MSDDDRNFNEAAVVSAQQEVFLPLRPYMLWALLILSIQQWQQFLLIGTPEQDPVLARFPQPFQYFWFIAFIFFAMMVFIGATLFRKKWAGFMMERAGSFMLGTLMLSSVVLSLPLAEQVGMSIPQLLLAEWLIITFCVASFAHFWDVGRYLKRVTRLAREKGE